MGGKSGGDRGRIGKGGAGEPFDQPTSSDNKLRCSRLITASGYKRSETQGSVQVITSVAEAAQYSAGALASTVSVFIRERAGKGGSLVHSPQEGAV